MSGNDGESLAHFGGGERDVGVADSRCDHFDEDLTGFEGGGDLDVGHGPVGGWGVGWGRGGG